MDFLVAPLAHDAILGKPWLEATNPSIDWKNNILTFTDETGETHTWNAFEDYTGELLPEDYFLMQPK